MNPITKLGRALGSLWTPIETKSRGDWVYMNVTDGEKMAAKWDIKNGAEYIARLMGWVAICAEKNATFLNSAQLNLYREGTTTGRKLSTVQRMSLKSARRKSRYATDEATKIERHEVLTLLDNPNDYESGSDFSWLRHYSKEACGNAFCYFTDGQLITLRPQYINVIPGAGEDLIWGWRYGRETSKEIDLPHDEVLQFKHNPSIRNPFWGEGPTSNCYKYADMQMYASQAELERWRNDGRPPAYAKLPDTMNDDQFKAAVDRMRDQIRGVENAGNWLYGQAVEVTSLGFAPKDMEYINGQTISQKAIWAAFGIPESIINPNDGNKATATQGLAFYNEMTLWPRACRDADQLTYEFRRVGLIEDRMFFAYDSITQQDEAAQATILQTLTNSGIRTLNEARAILGDDPYPDEITGDTPRINGQPVAHIIEGAGEPTAQVGVPVDPRATPEPDMSVKDATTSTLNGAQVTSLVTIVSQVAAGMIPYESGRSIAIAAFPGVDDTTINGIFAPVKNFEQRVDAPAPVTAEKHRRSCGCGDCRKGRKDKPLVNQEAASKMQSELMAWLKEAAGNVANGIIEVTAEQHAQLEAIVKRNLTDAYELTLKAEIPEGIPRVVNQGAIARINQENSLIIEQITGRTNDDIRRAVAVGIEEGKTYSQIADDIESSGYPSSRAEVIARTETANASSMGRMDGMEAAGVKTKAWFIGGSPCPICEYIAAKVAKAGGSIPISEPFAVAGEFEGITKTIWYPPAHPNCVCDFAGGPNG